MKSFPKYILIATLTLTACNNDIDNMDENPVAAKISAAIGEHTRAVNTSWNKGDSIGVSMGDRYSNIKYVTDNGDGLFGGATMYFINKHVPVTITAYYPYSGSEGQLPSVIEASTRAELQTDSEQPKFDFLYALQENQTGANPDVNLTFNHQMSKLTLIFKNGNAGTDVSKITSCLINGLILEGSFNPVNGVCSAKTDVSSSALNLSPTMKDGNAFLSLILFPQTIDKVTMKIADKDNQEYGCELKFEDNRLEAGNNYLYTINVKKTELNVEKSSIVKWTEIEYESDAKSE